MKILFVAMTDSIHTARWVNPLAKLGWEVHLFPVYAAKPTPELRDVTVYGLALGRPENLHSSVRYVGLLPIGKSGGLLERLAFRSFPRWWETGLDFILRAIQPEIIHSLEFQHSAYLALPVILKARKAGVKTPKWIATNWGSDIYLFGRLTEHRERIRAILEACDFYSCECERDVRLARNLGLRGRVLPVFPNTGGFDLELAARLRQPGPVSQRRVILLKGYQHWAGRALIGLRALARCADLLRAGNYRVAIFSASPEVKIAAELFQQETGITTELLPQVSHTEMLSWYGRARLYLGLSISDAISTSLLEAIVMGAFPIQSCTACADEWLENGKTGLIVPPEDTDIIERALRQGLQEDELVNQAAESNARLAQERLDQAKIQPLVADFYERVSNSPAAR